MPDYYVAYGGTNDRFFEADDDEAAERKARTLVAIAPRTRAFLYREIATLAGVEAESETPCRPMTRGEG
jgi:hypothetical protein